MAGLYFHIPFCKRICSYCDFFRGVRLNLLDGCLQAMHAELDEQRNFLRDKKIDTIYFGGGTPSLVAPDRLQALVEHAAQIFDCNGVGEMTVEANPDDISEEYVKQLRQTSINRVSLGVQSFDDAELRFMNRRHTASEAEQAVKRLQDAGIENITIDLIFGVDGFGEEVLLGSIERALALGVQHMSAYHLTIEPDTAFGRRLQRGQMKQVSEQQSELEYMLLHNHLTSSGYEHYEVSNYALPGYRAVHNSSYWQGVEYLGIGAGAHSYNGVQRHYVEQDLEEYITRREYIVEELTEQDFYNEYVMTALRRMEGVDLNRVKSKYGDAALRRVLDGASQWLASGDVVKEGDVLRIPAEKFMISDAVIESMFEV